MNAPRWRLAALWLGYLVLTIAWVLIGAVSAETLSEFAKKNTVEQTLSVAALPGLAWFGGMAVLIVTMADKLVPTNPRRRRGAGSPPAAAAQQPKTEERPTQ